ncbi:Metallo-dependent phosphatase-like protein [Aspergillus karnatakaensis]|uniref:endopolyphosphatase n=1 Tax=Aspergillus karnatakaensis TaxID=1810916 RepID=UPI003CCDA943
MISTRFFPLLYGLGLVACARAAPITEQQVLGLDNQEDALGSSNHLSGRFLHITDFHLDSHYKPGTSDERVCHRGQGSAGQLGAAGTECDSPAALVDETFRWIEKNLKGKIDFVLWTGDSARHDNDEKIPRTANEILDLNEILANKFIDLFEDRNTVRGLSIPIIPTIGNNDIMPHNIFKEGPNRWTRRFTEIWGQFIPEHERHTFEEGGWFSADVIPNHLTAISLNTMYFYESNSAVDGCAAKSEPGYEHMEWLRIQLEILRERKMKAILIGHVPPARAGEKRSWDESCWQKYTLFTNRFRDVVAGSVYGHMNVDHFMLQDSRQVDILLASQDTPSDPEFMINSRSDYLSSLREDWAEMPSPPAGTSSSFFSDDWDSETEQLADSVDASSGALGKKERRFLKKIGGPFAERYSLSLVSPSVVPNYFPTLRVVEYNISGLEGIKTWADTPANHAASENSVWDSDENDEITDEENDSADDIDELRKRKKNKKNKNKKNKKEKIKKPHFTVPDHPSKSTPPGPAYSNQALTWLSYAQYYANLTRIDEQAKSKSSNISQPSEDEQKTSHALDLYQVEYDTRDDKVYKMKDLTVRSFFQLAKRIANKKPRKSDLLASDLDTLDTSDDETDTADKKNNKRRKKHKNRVWRTFLNRAFVGYLTEEELDDIKG